MDLALSHRLSFYDACYLELAERAGAALATIDRRLAQAAAASRVKLSALMHSNRAALVARDELSPPASDTLPYRAVWTSAGPSD